jgi:hypothetical protein
MNPSVRSASIALLAMLAAVSPCLAGVGMAPGRGALGGQIGGSFFWADGDYSEGAQARFAFDGHFRYVMSTHLRWQISAGFTWAGYSASTPIAVPDGRYPGDTNKSNNLTLLLPVSAQLHYVVHTKKWHHHLGAGPGFYRVWVENHREVLPDPATLVLHRKIHPGLTVELGTERFLRQLQSTSIEAKVATHWVFAQDDQDYPTGYNNSLGATELRIGANYYFDMSRVAEKSTAK